MLWIIPFQDGKKMTELCTLPVTTRTRTTRNRVNASRGRFSTYWRPATGEAAHGRPFRRADSIAAHIRSSAGPTDWGRASSIRAGRTRNRVRMMAGAGPDPAGRSRFPAFRRGPRPRPGPFRVMDPARRRTAARARASPPQGGVRSAELWKNCLSSPGRASNSRAHIGCGMQPRRLGRRPSEAMM